MTILEYPKFEQELYEASCAELKAIKAECGNEHLYSFALSTTGLFGYIFPNANTEEGILRAAKEHIVEARGFRGHLDMAAISARWEPSLYWRFFRQQNQRFDKVNAMLVNVQDKLCKLSGIDFDITTTKIEDCLFSVLDRMRAENLFGTNVDNFYTILSYHDQSDEDFYRCALRVNSKSLCSKMQKEMLNLRKFMQEQEAG